MLVYSTQLDGVIISEIPLPILQENLWITVAAFPAVKGQNGWALPSASCCGESKLLRLSIQHAFQTPCFDTKDSSHPAWTTAGHHMCIQTRGCKYSNELLMMSGMALETCWAFNQLRNNKFYYKVASCWLFLLIHQGQFTVTSSQTAEVIRHRNCTGSYFQRISECADYATPKQSSTWQEARLYTNTTTKCQACLRDAGGHIQRAI